MTAAPPFVIFIPHTVTTKQNMRTKTLLIAAAALVAGVISSEAQTPVYSANVVGYVSATTTNGYALLSNPLDFDGSGTNNTVVNLFGTNLPVGTQIETWNPSSGFSGNSYAATKSGNQWQNPSQQLPPGQGFFILSSAVRTNTFTGTVLQGGLTNQFLTGAGYSLISGNFPVAGGITTTYGYHPSVGDQVETWSPATGFSGNSYAATKSGNQWQNGEPQITPGQGIFLLTTNTHPVMGTNFVVQ